MNDEQNKMGAGRPFKMNNWLTALKGVLADEDILFLSDKDLVFLVNNLQKNKRYLVALLKNGKLVNFT
jgi:hypothetical protein